VEPREVHAAFSGMAGEVGLFNETIALLDSMTNSVKRKTVSYFPGTAHYEILQSNRYISFLEIGEGVFLEHRTKKGVLDECPCSNIREVKGALVKFLGHKSEKPKEDIGSDAEKKDSSSNNEIPNEEETSQVSKEQATTAGKIMPQQARKSDLYKETLALMDSMINFVNCQKMWNLPFTAKYEASNGRFVDVLKTGMNVYMIYGVKGGVVEECWCRDMKEVEATLVKFFDGESGTPEKKNLGDGAKKNEDNSSKNETPPLTEKTLEDFKQEVKRFIPEDAEISDLTRQTIVLLDSIKTFVKYHKVWISPFHAEYETSNGIQFVKVLETGKRVYLEYGVKKGVVEECSCSHIKEVEVVLFKFLTELTTMQKESISSGGSISKEDFKKLVPGVHMFFLVFTTT